MSISKKRIYKYDLLKIIACIGIILIHNCNSVIIQAIVRTALPIFVVISGALLDSPIESNKSFYSKRFLRILVPFFVYSFIYIIFNIYGTTEDFKISETPFYIYTILKGPMFRESWFVYMILGLYLCTPFLKIMCKNLSQKDMKNLFILLTIITVMNTLLPAFNLEIGITNVVFSGWVIYYLLGYVLKKSVVLNKHRRIFYVLGIISFVISAFEYKYYFLNMKDVYNFAITIYLQTISVFLFFNNMKFNPKGRCRELLLFFSKYTFEVYLIHGAIMVVLYRINDKFEIITNNFIYHILSIPAVVILSFLAAYIIHNLLVEPIDKLIRLLVSCFKNNKRHRLP